MSSVNTTPSVAFQIGVLAGAAFLPGLLIVANLRTFKSGRRVNAKCILATLLFLGMWLCFGLFGAARQNGYEQKWLLMSLGTLAILCLVSGPIFAILGLIEFRRRSLRYRKGKKRAIFVIVASMLMLLPVIAGFANGVKTAAANQPKTIGAPGEAAVIEAWNFKMTPPSGWVRIDETKLGGTSITRLALVHRENARLIVLAERSADSPLSSLVEFVKGRFKADGGVILSERSGKVHDIEAVCLEMNATKEGYGLFYQNWCFTHNGIFYQHITWGQASENTLVRSEGEKLIEAFQLIDLKRTAFADGKTIVPYYVSPQHAFRVDLRGTKWNRSWDLQAQEFPSGEYGAAHQNGTDYFGVIALWLGDELLDDEALECALANQLGIPYPGKAAQIFFCKRV